MRVCLCLCVGGAVFPACTLQLRCRYIQNLLQNGEGHILGPLTGDHWCAARRGAAAVAVAVVVAGARMPGLHARTPADVIPPARDSSSPKDSASCLFVFLQLVRCMFQLLFVMWRTTTNSNNDDDKNNNNNRPTNQPGTCTSRSYRRSARTRKRTSRWTS